MEEKANVEENQENQRMKYEIRNTMNNMEKMQMKN